MTFMGRINIQAEHTGEVLVGLDDGRVQRLRAAFYVVSNIEPPIYELPVLDDLVTATSAP